MGNTMGGVRAKPLSKAETRATKAKRTKQFISLSLEKQKNYGEILKNWIIRKVKWREVRHPKSLHPDKMIGFQFFVQPIRRNKSEN